MITAATMSLRPEEATEVLAATVGKEERAALGALGAPVETGRIVLVIKVG